MLVRLDQVDSLPEDQPEPARTRLPPDRTRTRVALLAGLAAMISSLVAFGGILFGSWALSHGPQYADTQTASVPGAYTVLLDHADYTVHVYREGLDAELCGGDGRGDERCMHPPEVDDVTLRAQGAESSPPVDLRPYNGDDPSGLYSLEIDEPGAYTVTSSGSPAELELRRGRTSRLWGFVGPAAVISSVLVLSLAACVGFSVVLYLVLVVLRLAGTTILRSVAAVIRPSHSR